MNIGPIWVNPLNMTSGGGLIWQELLPRHYKPDWILTTRDDEKEKKCISSSWLSNRPQKNFLRDLTMQGDHFPKIFQAKSRFVCRKCRSGGVPAPPSSLFVVGWSWFPSAPPAICTVPSMESTRIFWCDWTKQAGDDLGDFGSTIIHFYTSDRNIS